MNVSELYALTKWVNEEVEKKKIPGKYQALQNILQHNSQPNQQKQPFEKQKNDLIESIKSVAIEQLTQDQYEFLSRLGIAGALGNEGVEAIEDILFKNAIDIATSFQKIGVILQKLVDGINKSSQLKGALQGNFDEHSKKISEEVIIRVRFAGRAGMENLTDFKEWGSVWYDIGRGIAMVHGATPEDVKVVGAATGSIVIELAVFAGIAATASKIILDALGVAEKVLDIRKKAEELRALKLQNSRLADDLEQEAQNEKNAGIENITVIIVEQLQIGHGEGDKTKALDTAVKNLVNFVEKGGVVDFVMSDDDQSIAEDEVAKRQELRSAFQEIRKLENKLYRIEHKKD